MADWSCRTVDNCVNFLAISPGIENNSNPSQSKSDDALISRLTNSDSDELTQLRRQLDAANKKKIKQISPTNHPPYIMFK